MVSYLYPRSGGVLFHGDIMAKEDLIPVRTEAEAKEKGRRGGIASGKSRRQKKTLREALLILLEKEDRDGASGSEKVAVSLFEKAIEGDTRAASLLHDICYGKPVSTIEMTGKGGTPLQPPAITVEFIKDAD